MSYWLLLLKRMIFQHYLFHCCAATQSCLTLCDLMDCSTPGFSVLHCLLEFAQTHVHWVNDVNKLFHPQSPLRPPALNLSKHQGLFQWIGSLPPHGLQYTRLLCPSPYPGACSNSCPSSRWYHPTISAVPFSSCLQSFPASGSFLLSQLFASGGQSIGA